MVTVAIMLERIAKSNDKPRPLLLVSSVFADSSGSTSE